MDDLIRKARDTVLYCLTRKATAPTSGEMCDAAIREYIRLAEQVQHVAGGDCAECGPLRVEVERLRREVRCYRMTLNRIAYNNSCESHATVLDAVTEIARTALTGEEE